MKLHKKIVSVILMIGLLAGSVSVHPVEAKMVEVKTKSSNSELKVSLLNENLDYQLKEVAFKIKNKTNQKIKVTKVSVQYKRNGEWTTLKKQKNSVLKRNIVINSGKTVYDGVNLKTDYVISKNGLEGGKYSIHIKYKYNGRYYYKRTVFSVKGKKLPERETTTRPVLETTPDDATAESPQPDLEPTMKPRPPANSIPKDDVTAENKPNTATSGVLAIKIKLVNTDFSIEKNGKASLMVFSEADYKKASKTKIFISIQKKANGKWKKYKNFKVVKKSNIAFANKQIQMKKKGTYRMSVRIVFYGNGKKRKQYKTKSKVQMYS